MFQGLVPNSLSTARILSSVFHRNSTFIRSSGNSRFLPMFLKKGNDSLRVFRTFRIVRRFLRLAKMSIFSSPSGRILSTSNSTMITVFIFRTRITAIRRTIFISSLNHNYQIIMVTFRNIMASITRFALCTCQAFFTHFQVSRTSFNRFMVATCHVMTSFHQVISTQVYRTKQYFHRPMCTNRARRRFFFRLFRRFRETGKTYRSTNTRKNRIRRTRRQIVRLNSRRNQGTVGNHTPFLISKNRCSRQVRFFSRSLYTSVHRSIRKNRRSARTIRRECTTT